VIEATRRMRQTRQDEGAWWLRVPLVLIAPRQVFAALRNDSDEAAEARQEPLAAIVLLAGMAGVLMTASAGRLLDRDDYDALVVLVWTIAGGALNGIGAYFIGGGAVYLAASFLGGLGSYRRARHLVGFAAVPIVLALALWPVRVALFGGDEFRTGGSDDGTAGAVFDAIDAALVVWSCVLLAVGVRTVHGWSWARSLVTVVVALVVLGAVYGVVAAA
jgi:hypothetical protein